MNFKFLISCLLVFSVTNTAVAQDINVLVQNARKKIASVNDYTANGRMKTNVAFLKVPVANVKVYFKKPNRLTIKSENGLSFIPKGAVSINLNNIVGAGDYTVIDAGKEKLGSGMVRVARLLPNDVNSEVVLSTIYIDETTSLVRKAKTTTRENGTYELDLTYGKYAAYGLPDKVLFSFNTKDYKLPKGMTFDFDDGSSTAPADKSKNKKGQAEITFSNYAVNKGVADAVFK